MRKVTFFALCVLAIFENVYDVEAKVFTKCGLTKELLNNGFDRSYVGNWVCLIESESAKNSSKVTQKANGYTSYGLFQINSKDWCKSGSSGGKCRAKCEDFLDDDIRDDSICAKFIQSELGFRNWEGWKRSCYDFIDDDIRDDSICARLIQSELGFRNWQGWERSCYRRRLSIPSC